MKSKDLIAALQREDPSGETEVCIGNSDIHCVYSSPAWYDGPLETLLKDPARKGFYDVCGAKFVREGEKIMIEPVSIYDAIHNDPEIPVECKTDRDRECVAAWRKEAREIREERIRDAKACI